MNKEEVKTENPLRATLSDFRGLKKSKTITVPPMRPRLSSATQRRSSTGPSEAEYLLRNANKELNNLVKIPRNIHHEIYKFLNTKELFKLGGLCRRVKETSEDKIIWQGLVGTEQKNEFDNGAELKQEFLREKQCSGNMEKHAFYLYDLQGHIKGISSIDVLGRKIVTGSKDNQVKFWDISKSYQ